MSEQLSGSDPELQTEQQLLSPAELAKQQRWHDYIVPLHNHLHAAHITFGEHSGSHYDRLIHGPKIVEHLIEQGGERESIEAAFPSITRHIKGRPTRIVTTSERIFELLKPYRDTEFRLDREKRDKILERSRAEYGRNRTINFGFQLHEAVSGDTSFGGVTLDAIAALTLALEKTMRQQKAG